MKKKFIVVVVILVFLLVIILLTSQQKKYVAVPSNTHPYTNHQRNLEATVSALMVSSQKELARVQELSSQKHLSQQQQQELYITAQAAITNARAASDARPDVAATWINLSNVYQQFIGKDFQNADTFAIASLEEAIKAEPKSYLSYYQLGMLYLQLQDYAKAKEFLQQAFTLVPEKDTRKRSEINQQLQKL
ncbi:MAG TPA: tetratricopeptide repeat protein [Candidatus Saccharimonadales bacterium]|nr:tetratricopeptide repeat protein [Candidatus Saccharimonadales bacterium]